MWKFWLYFWCTVAPYWCWSHYSYFMRQGKHQLDSQSSSRAEIWRKCWLGDGESAGADSLISEGRSQHGKRKERETQMFLFLFFSFFLPPLVCLPECGKMTESHQLCCSNELVQIPAACYSNSVRLDGKHLGTFIFKPHHRSSLDWTLTRKIFSILLQPLTHGKLCYVM